MDKLTWDPTIPNQRVRVRRNPGKQGVTTGKTELSANRLFVLVKFGPNESSLKQYDQIELCEQEESIEQLLQVSRYGHPDDLRRILTFEKVKGSLTNVFYSMESSNTDFYAYQFKPVLKFLESPVGRLLIADEVGLGKTVEAMYIWKELQAREDARRLLIVCPAILRDKWVNDIKTQFNLNAEVVEIKNLQEKLQSLLTTGNPNSFIYVASLEGLRCKNWDDGAKGGGKVELARLLDDNQVKDEFSLFDLVIIDEAHYLRNPETANYKLGQLLREASRHLLLLTATPIQIRSTNLYQLLKLVSPEDFFDKSIFEKMLKANKPVVEALRLIWRTPSDIEGAKQAIRQATKSDYFSKSYRLQRVREELETVDTLKPEVQVQLGQLLESSSLFGQFMTRSRKREVMENRVKRTAQTLSVNFTEQERQVYDYVTHQIRIQAIQQKGASLFSLIARQRQMASCMVAALEAWKNKGIIENFLSTKAADEELLYEIFGSELDATAKFTANRKSVSPVTNILECPFPQDKTGLEKFIDGLKKQDTKYSQLIKFLRSEFKNNKQNKFILFAYFRDTLTYLQRRLAADEINTYVIMGGMSREDKQETLDLFKANNSNTVLLSSEVGSEGIDLQFCRFLINYDLPWNPMRVEQRIGRIDRLGQKANKISIINFNLKDTIEEYILEKLYSRIKIFEESIGDLEEILGELTEQLLIDLLNPTLNKEELKQQAEQTILAIVNKAEQQRKLEDEAINLVAFSDYILNTINQSRVKGRWLRPEELKAFVEDFFRLQYPGTVITPNQSRTDAFDISLADEAKVDLKMFCQQRSFSTPTRLYSQTITCFFNPKLTGTLGKRIYELLDPSHPLIQWIRYKYEPESNYKEGALSFHPVSASLLTSQEVSIEPGIYVYVIHRWELSGLRTENRLAYKAICLSNWQILTDNDAEMLIDKAVLKGESRPNANNLVGLTKILAAYKQCEELLQKLFSDVEVAFDAENADWCNVQERSVRAYASRKQQEYKERIEKLESQNKLKTIPALEGKIKQSEQTLNIALKKIEQKRQILTASPALAAGVIFVV